jgi:membrane fusion protein, multidrug efflux system
LINFGKEAQKAGPPPEMVSTTVAQQQAWETTIAAVASVVSAKGVQLSNDAPGVVSRIHFESGDTVKQGEILVELDTSVERAQLQSIQARRELAESSLKRTRALVSSGVSPSAQVETDESSSKSLKADASALEAQIARKSIRAPFSGKLGIRAVNLGQYLAPGTMVTVLESTETVYIDFTLPQRELSRVNLGMTVRAVQETGDKPIAGTVAAIDPSIDPSTRSVKVRASLPNETNRFRPGMFVRVELVMPEQSKVVVAPLTAVVHASYGDSVFVIEPKADGEQTALTARQQFVRLGEARGDFVAIAEGVQPGQELASAGAFKLRNGLPVVVKNDGSLKPELTPHPANR